MYASSSLQPGNRGRSTVAKTSNVLMKKHATESSDEEGEVNNVSAQNRELSQKEIA